MELNGPPLDLHVPATAKPGKPAPPPGTMATLELKRIITIDRAMRKKKDRAIFKITGLSGTPDDPVQVNDPRDTKKKYRERILNAFRTAKGLLNKPGN